MNRPDKDFHRTLQALKLATPIALATRFDDSYSHAVEASLSGAELLRQRGIDARAVPCGILGAT
jgi:hypothetical protein